jgi:hypothetical protein
MMRKRVEERATGWAFRDMGKRNERFWRKTVVPWGLGQMRCEAGTCCAGTVAWKRWVF